MRAFLNLRRRRVPACRYFGGWPRAISGRKPECNPGQVDHTCASYCIYLQGSHRRIVAILVWKGFRSVDDLIENRGWTMDTSFNR